jgi:hypothetical protein
MFGEFEFVVLKHTEIRLRFSYFKKGPTISPEFLMMPSLKADSTSLIVYPGV